MKRGITFTQVLIAFFILCVGVVSLIKALPVISRLSSHSKNALLLSLISENIFATIETIYSSPGGPPVPVEISGREAQLPGCEYTVRFIEARKDLYDIELEIRWKEEGTLESKTFHSSFRRR